MSTSLFKMGLQLKAFLLVYKKVTTQVDRLKAEGVRRARLPYFDVNI